MTETETTPPTFTPAGLGASIFEERYAHDGETWVDACRRVARTMAAAEDNGKRAVWEERFYERLVSGQIMPGGRIMYGAGRPKQQLMNCFVIETGDSREAWGKSISDMLVTSGMGGGVGCNFSDVRGRGYPVGGTGGVATGAVSLMQMWDKVGDILVSGGGRRLALMLSLDIDHPDIEEFLDVKLNRGELNNANISVVLPSHLSSETFQKLVREDGDIELRFNGLPDREHRTIKARVLWERLVQNAWDSGEPGVLNGYLANKMNNLFYKYALPTTNPCGEQWLPSYGSCNLGALVLPRFVQNGKLDWDLLEDAIRVGIRFHDNVITVNNYPLPEMRMLADGERRIGFGVMGLHSMMLDLGLKYNSPEGLTFVDKLFAFIKHTAYDTSINIAIEKGPFPYYSPEFCDSGFMKTMKPAIRRKVREYGIRNCALLTIAPTGTTSMVHGVTGGIEPLFAPAYIRRRKKIDEKANEYLVETLVISKEYVDHPELCQGAYDITPRDHMEMQKVVQKHLDSSLSKTVNLPKDFPVDELSDLWLEYLPFMKGSTFYRQGSRGQEPMMHVALDDVKRLLETWEGELEYETTDVVDDCASGSCDF
jgi:ribonucleoside-diphosphate reductase alpha chain